MSPPATDDPFALFGLPRRLAIDVASLRAAHRRLAAAEHPDRAGGASAAADAARRSAAVNEAYRAIAEPLARAETLLRLAGSEATEREGGSANEEMPPGFLVEMMEWREAIEDADASGDVARLSGMEREATERRDDLLKSLDQAFAAIDATTGPARRDLLRLARQRLNALRYVERILARIAMASE